MIRQSLIILEGISYTKEKNIWTNGVYDWNDFINKEKIKGVSRKRKIYYDYSLKIAQKNLMDDNSSYFCKILPLKDHWRLYKDFKDCCIFLDLETSSVNNGYITCITLFNGFDTMTFVRGYNLDLNIIKNILKDYKMIITFNGNTFDIPFLKKKLENVIPEVPCWDLRHTCNKLGYKGSLKDIEKQLNIERKNKIVERMYGGDPLKLWKTFLATGDMYYIDLLVEYNQEDTINLKIIADKTYSMLVNDSYVDNFA